MQEKRAVEAGYWHLYRYNPDLKKEGKNPFILDSKEPTKDYKEFIHSEIRYSQLMNVFPGSLMICLSCLLSMQQKGIEDIKAGGT